MLLFDYAEIANFLDAAVGLGLFILLCFSFYYILYFIESMRKPKKIEKGEKKYKYAILVPARNEDKVISNLLQSLKNQDYDKDYFDVYVIIESKDDPTLNITKKFGFNVIVRKNLINRRTKGFALDEGITYLKENNLKYDAYVIFDADNVVESNYLSLMNDVKNKGYQVGVGYRNFTNSKKNWVSSCSATLFSFMNQFTSKGRSKFFEKATLTGTGYYIDANIVEDAGGWIWTGFTEDVALTTYCYYHNVSMHYYPYAVYYDEQPTKFKVLHKQHIRWVFGFFEKKDKYKKKEFIYNQDHLVRRRIGIMEYNLSIWPLASFLIIEILALIGCIVLLIFAILFEPSSIVWTLSHTIFNLLLLYLSLCFAGFISIMLDKKNLKFGFWKSLVVILTYPFFMCDFIFAFFDGLFHKKKRTTWDKIEHSGEIINAKAKELENDKKR